MKSNFFVLIFLFPAYFASCQSQTNKIVEQFKTVDSSLQKSNYGLDYTLLSIYRQIQNKKETNQVLAAQADTIVKKNEDVTNYIESLKQKLHDLDSSGININIASDFLMNTSNSTILESKLNSLFSSCNHVITDTKRIEAENIFTAEKEMNRNKNWAKDYFYMTPTVAAITILNKFSNDCLNLTVFSLTEIKSKLIN